MERTGTFFFSVSFRISYFDDFWEINLRVCVLIGGGVVIARNVLALSAGKN